MQGTARRRSETSVQSAQADCHEDESQPTIVAGEGWGPVRIGAASKAVIAFLGNGQPGSGYSSGYFKGISAKGSPGLIRNTSNTVHAIYFYNGQRDSGRFEVFCWHTNNGINWQSSVDEVKKAYGHPTAEFSGANAGNTWQRLVFEALIFVLRTASWSESGSRAARLWHLRLESTQLSLALIGEVKCYFTSPVRRVVSMGRRNAQLEPTLH